MKKDNLLIFLVLDSFKKLFIKISSNLNSYIRPLTKEEKKFIEENSSFWNQYKPKQREQEEEKYIYVQMEDYPLILVGNAHISSFIAAAENAKLLFLLPSRLKKSWEKVLKSFPNSTFIYQDCLYFLIFRIYSFFETLKTIYKFKTPDDVLNFKVDGVQFGDLIYDAYLSYYNYATMREVDRPNLFSIIHSFFYERRVIKNIINHYNIKASLVSHTNIGIATGVHSRYLVRNNIELWERWVTLKKHKSIDSLYESAARLNMKYLKFMQSNLEYFIPLAEKHLKNRLENKNSDFGARLPYASSKRVFKSSLEFNKHFGLDHNKRNVFVMLHAFNDGPHSFGFTIYRDYYEWFKKVLDMAQKVDSVNWIFKEHPGREYYPTKDLDLDELFSKINVSNIRFLNSDADFNTSSLRYIADVILTCVGTAGLEYSAFGIPCVLGGKSWYSGFGFTIDPCTDAEFKRILENIDKLPRLNNEQINLAKIIALFTFDIVEFTKFPDPFRTVCTFNSAEQRAFTSEQIFKRIVESRLKSSQEEKNRYIKSLEEFIKNPDFIQFVDLEKHSCFRKIIGLQEQALDKEERQAICR